MNKWFLVVGVLMLGVITPAAAQHSHPVGRPAQKMDKPLPVVPPPAGAACVQQSDLLQIMGASSALRLTSDQLVSLQSVEAQIVSLVQSATQEAVAAYARAGDLLKDAAPDWAAYESELRAGAEKMIAARVALARGDLAARNVLSSEQLALFNRQRQGARAAGIVSLACMTT
jgi:hypothetical protein